MENNFSASLQGQFLANLKERQTPSTIYTLNGFQIRGVVKDFDEVSVFIEYEGVTQMVYIHAISTIAPFQRNTSRGHDGPYNRQRRDLDPQ